MTNQFHDWFFNQSIALDNNSSSFHYQQAMTNQQHPITPPPELWEQWYESADDASEDVIEVVATKAANWGADQELEACCEWVESEIGRKEWAAELRTARRSKPPSLKELALKALDDISIASFEQDAANTIRYALEQLDD
jgi:hypothetical protein